MSKAIKPPRFAIDDVVMARRGYTVQVFKITSCELYDKHQKDYLYGWQYNGVRTNGVLEVDVIKRRVDGKWIAVRKSSNE